MHKSKGKCTGICLAESLFLHERTRRWAGTRGSPSFLKTPSTPKTRIPPVFSFPFFKVPPCRTPSRAFHTFCRPLSLPLRKTCIARTEGYGAIDLGYCMLFLENPGALEYIRDILRSVTEEMQSEEGAGDETLLTIHLHANRLLISALISKDKFFEAKSLLLDMKAQDFDAEFADESLAEVEEKIRSGER